MSAPANPRAANDASYRLGAAATGGGQHVGGMSPRQRELNRRYSYFRGTCYDHRTVDWNGDAITDTVDTEGMPRERAIPPGFNDVYGNTMSLKYRRPRAPYYLGKIVVKRFTGLLFSHRRHPKVKVIGDPMTEDWIAGAAEAGRLWAQAVSARDLGGAMGSVGFGFEINNGVPLFEVFDPRYATPVFKNRLTKELASIEMRWTYKDWFQMLDGEWVEAVFWSRRVVDDTHDTLWTGVLAGENGEEPDWAAVTVAPVQRAHRCVDERGQAACPVEWIQNIEVPGEIDGAPDCDGAFELFEEIDTLNSQASLGIVANCDPTLVMSTDDELAQIQKGSNVFIRIPKGDTAEYLEMEGSGPKSAVDQADRMEAKALRICRCVIDQSRNATQKTATEVERDYSDMWEAADVLREQYGERGIKRLLTKLVATARKLMSAGPVLNETTGVMERVEIVLPPKVETDTKTGKQKITQRSIGNGMMLTFQWPGYTTPTVQDAVQSVTAATTAMNGGLVDAEHAAQFVAGIFQVEDTRAMLAAMKAQQAADEAAFAQQTTGDTTAPVDATAADTGDAEPVKFFQYEMEAGIVTINEMRATKNLPPLEIDGDLTLPQYKQKYAQVFAAATVATSPLTAAEIVGLAPPTTAPGGDAE